MNVASNKVYTKSSFFTMKEFQSLHRLARDGTENETRECLQSMFQALTERKFIKILNKLDDSGQSPLHCAVRSNNLGAIQALVEFGADVNCRGEDDITPLMTAARSRNDGKPQEEEQADEEMTFKILASRGSRVNQTDIYGQGAIHYSVMRNNVNFLRLLLNSDDIQVELRDKQGMTPAHFAAAYGHFDVMKMLIENNINILCFDMFNKTPLHLSASVRDDRICRLLLDTLKEKYSQEFISILNMKDFECRTPLHTAIEKDNVSVAKMLISAGSDCNLTSYGDNHPIHLASKANSVEILELLIASKARVNVRNAKRESPLHIAAAFDKPKNIEYLIKNNADTEVREVDRFTPIMLAASFGNTDSVQVLLRNRARIASVEKNDRNSIFLAAQENQSVVLTVLLEHCTNTTKPLYINSTDRFGDTPLNKASENGYHKVVEILLKNGANSAIKNDSEQTAMHLGAQNGFLKVIKIITSHDPTLIHGEDENSNTPLHLAAFNGHKEVVKFLIENNADIEARNQFLWTPLDCAASSGNVKVCKILLNDDAPIDAKDRANTTPLHLAAAAGHSDVVSLLLDEGADVSIKDANGFNPLDRAINNNQRDAAQTILNSPKWREALRNKYYCENRNEIITPLRELIQKMPDVAYKVLSSGITTNGKSTIDHDFTVLYNYEFLDDMFVSWTEGETDQASLEEQPTPLMKKQSLLPPKKHKIVHTLEWMVKYKKKELLGHPLSRQLIYSKWVNYGQYFFYVNLILSLLFTVSLSTYLFLSQSPNLQNFSTGCPSAYASEGTKVIAIIFKYITFGVAGCLLLREIIQFIRAPVKYFSFINLMDIASFSICIIALLDITYCNKQTGIREGWQWQMATVSVFLGCMNTILIMQKVTLFGIYVIMFFNILKTFLNLSIILILFVASFGIVFNLLLANQVPFKGYQVFLKTVVMMIGEIDYGNIFTSTEQIPYPHATYPLFIIFIVFMIIIAMNLLVGLAVDDIKGVQEEALLQKLAKQVELAMEAESFLGSKIVKRFTDAKQLFYPNKKQEFMGLSFGFNKPIEYKVYEQREESNQTLDTIIEDQDKIKGTLKHIKKSIMRVCIDQEKMNKMLLKIVGDNESDQDDSEE